MTEQKTLREQLIEWVTDYKDVASRNALAETPKESADYLLSLIRKEVEGARLTETQIFDAQEQTKCSSLAMKEHLVTAAAQLEAVMNKLGKV
jgi:hypothetical protein